MANELREDSGFQSFSLSLPSGGSITGIKSIPPKGSSSAQRSKPLIVGLHGGTCVARYYDCTLSHSASTFSQMTGIPFIAIDRPCYGGSSTFPPLFSDENFWQKTAMLLHEEILPALWESFGISNDCAGIVLTSHSLAAPPSIIAASLDCQSETHRYPLAGIILSGWGVESNHVPMADMKLEDRALTPSVDLKKLMMLSEDEHAFYDEEILPCIPSQNVAMPIEEVEAARGWPESVQEYAAKVSVPIMYAMGERDWLWKASKNNMEEFEKLFPQCPRFDSSVVLGAPHALEWSKASNGWYLRCFGWAIEVCSSSQF